MKLRCSAIAITLLTASSGFSADLDRKELVSAVERLADRQHAMQAELNKLRDLLGLTSALHDLEPLKARKESAERLKVRTEDGIFAYNNGDFGEAKDLFQKAWEEAPEDPVAHYNLGLAYQSLGNATLAKTMLKRALELDPKLDGAEKISKYLAGSKVDEVSEELSSEERRLNTVLTNLKNEAESYMRSNSLSVPKRRTATVQVLRNIVDTVKGSTKLQQKHLMEVADTYALFELYGEAVEVLSTYENAMSGEVLPDDYHAKKLSLEEKYEELQLELDSYIGNRQEPKLRRRLTRDLEELEIFATQFDEFVKELDDSDPDFKKISKRLKEFRWGKQQNRNVIVANRFEELVFSSLKGTLPLDRYQDTRGQKFLKNITRLADRLQFKQVEVVEVDLQVNKEAVPYLVLYTYIPKHEAFIIVRIPKNDLS